MPPDPSYEALEALRGKYVEMLAMRLADHAGDEGDARVRVRMAELASRFPGALRELDDLEIGEIRRRAAALEAVIRDGKGVERWMAALTLFHSLARGALCAKRWLSGRKRVDAEIERAYAASVSALEFPDDARAWAGDLACIASPPRGRVSLAVLARIGRQLGSSERETRELVFGDLRRAAAHLDGDGSGGP